MNRLLLFFLVYLVSFQMGYSQVGNNMCEGALPFCTGTSYSFPAGVNAGTGQTGPYYDCLNTPPRRYVETTKSASFHYWVIFGMIALTFLVTPLLPAVMSTPIWPT